MFLRFFDESSQGRLPKSYRTPKDWSHGKFVIRDLYLQGFQPGAKVTVTRLWLETGYSSTTFEYIDLKIDHALRRASGGFRTKYCGVVILVRPPDFTIQPKKVTRSWLYTAYVLRPPF